MPTPTPACSGPRPTSCSPDDPGRTAADGSEPLWQAWGIGCRPHARRASRVGCTGGGRRRVDLGFLRRLYDGMGDYVSVYLDTDRVHEGNNSEATQIRWHDARRELAAAGADSTSLDAVADLVGDRDEAVAGRAMFARNGAIIFTGALDVPPRREIARFAPLPHLMPLLAQHRPPIPHVRVSATRTGGEVVAIGGGGDVWRDWMSGRQWPVHKVKVGGWSQDRIQRRAEETWDENARELAGEVIAAASQV